MPNACTQHALQYFTAGRDRRGVRGRARCREPDAAALGDEAGRSRPAGAVPRARARAPSDLACSGGARGASCYALVLVLVALVLGSQAVFGLFTPADLHGQREADVRHGEPHDPHGAVGAVGDVGPVRRGAPGRLGDRVGRGPSGPGAVLARLRRGRARTRSRWRCSRPTSVRSRGATEVPSDEVGMRRFERPEQLPPEPAQHARRTCSTAAASPTLRVRAATRARSLLFDVDTALAFQPRDALVDEVRSDSDLSLCGADAPRAPGDRDVLATSVPEVAAPRPASRSSSRSWRPRCRCDCSASGAGGVRALIAGVIGWGLAALLALGPRRTGTGAPTDVVAPHARDRDPGHDGGRGHARPAGAAGFARDRRARRSRRRAAPAAAVRRRIAVLRRYRELLRLARREGFGPFLSSAAAGRAVGRRRGVRLRRVLEEAGGVYIKLGQIAATRVDLLPPEICAELGAAAEPGRAGAGRRDPARARGRARCRRRRRCSPSSTGSRSPPRRSVRPTARGCAPVSPSSSRCSGRASRTSSSATSPRSRCSPNVAQRRTTFGQGVRSGELLEQFAAEPARGARLPPRGRRDGRDGAAARTALERAGPEGLPRAAARAGCSCRSASTASPLADIDAARRVRHRPHRRSPRSCCARRSSRCCGSGFFHADPHPGNIFAFADGTLGLIDFGAVGRLDPIQQAAVVDILAALVRRDVGLLRDGIERVADVHETRRRRSGSSARSRG